MLIDNKSTDIALRFPLHFPQYTKTGMGNLFRYTCQNRLKSMAKILRVPTNSSCFPMKISVKSKQKVCTSSDVIRRKKKEDHVLVSETSAAVFLLTHFRGLARVPQKRARVPNLARAPGVAHPCAKTSVRIIVICIFQNLVIQTLV